MSATDALPLRLTTDEVCDLARFGEVTLWRRIRDGKMPRPVDRARQHLFDRDAVLRALGMKQDAPEPPGRIKTNADAFREARARQIRHAPPKGGRKPSRVLSGSGE